MLRFQLAFGEIFVHICQEGASCRSEYSIVLRIGYRDDELFVEIIHGKNMEDLGKVTPPANLMTAKEADMEKLGLMLLHKLVHDFHQVNISDITYIWFKIA